MYLIINKSTLRSGAETNKTITMNKQLKEAVLNQIGVTAKEFKQYASDYRDASAGISGFIYYSDTRKFAVDNQSLIVELLEELAEELAEDVVEMVSSFGVFCGEMDKDEKKDLYKFLGGNKNLDDYETNSVLNVLAWLCVEQLAFELEN